MNDFKMQKRTFSAISIKQGVASRFRKFSKKVSYSHTETLAAMMNFFEYNSLSPHESLGLNMTTLESKIKKRINAVIAIIKDIEKHQIKPTNAMMNLLFKEAEQEQDEEQVLLEDVLTDGSSENLFTRDVELEYYRKQYFNTKENFNTLKDDFERVLNKTTYVRNNFGVGYYRLNITKAAFENLKYNLEHVHHHNTSKTN